ncbi:MAG: aminopeptidase [Oscillospiraceae bacterium]
MSCEKTQAEKLKDELFYKTPHSASVMTDEQIDLADKFCEDYISFLNEAKTEREVTAFVKDLAISKGFTEFDNTKIYNPGDKVYYVNREKAIILCVIGTKPLSEGVRIAAAHIDSPRIDLKPNPLYEDTELALLKTHYYGGIKKYQWTAIPLSLHGVVVKQDGTKVYINLGEKPGEPKFVITDLLPHLAQEQSKRKLNEGIKGEELNILVGSRPFKSDKGSDLVKLNIMKLINEKYGIVEKDFLCAELELVPAFEACDIGFDRSMIGGYGHDDRVCAYPAAIAAFNAGTPEHTLLSVLSDKEEIGSDGNTGLHSAYLRYFIADLGRMQGVEARDVLSNSQCLSADVNSAFDPTFPDVMEKKNCSYINRGVVVTKYTGSRGKSGTSDASAEFMAWCRDIFDKNDVLWQIGELGKVDMGGGGTVAMYIANLNVDVVDVGVPVLSMHAPFEVVSKLDVYMAYRAFLEFFKA